MALPEQELVEDLAVVCPVALKGEGGRREEGSVAEAREEE